MEPGVRAMADAARASLRVLIAGIDGEAPPEVANAVLAAVWQLMLRIRHLAEFAGLAKLVLEAIAAVAQ